MDEQEQAGIGSTDDASGVDKFNRLMDLVKDLIDNDTMIIICLGALMLIYQDAEIIKLVAAGFLGRMSQKGAVK